MSWREQYREASFRNVKFYVQNHELSGGRRGAVHEFPGQDVPVSEDMGRKVRRFSLDAYVLGDDYFTQRNRMLDAVEVRGAGKLVHPYLGTMDVLCTGFTLRETSGELRIARFTLQLVEAGAATFPTTAADTQGVVLRQKASAISAVRAAFVAAYRIAAVPYAITQNVLKTIDQGFSLIEEGKRTLSAVSDFQRDLQNMAGKVLQLAYDAAELAENVTDIITFGSDLTDTMVDVEATARAQFDEMLALDNSFQSDLPAPLNSTDPSTLINSMMQQSAIINAASLMSIMQYDSVNEARALQQTLFDRLDALAEDTDDDDLYTALIVLRKAVAEDVGARAIDLPSLVQYTPNYATNTLALTWLLYGELDREQDIISRNTIRNPALVPGSRSLEVLTNVE